MKKIILLSSLLCLLLGGTAAAQAAEFQKVDLERFKQMPMQKVTCTGEATFKSPWWQFWESSSEKHPVSIKIDLHGGLAAFHYFAEKWKEEGQPTMKMEEYQGVIHQTETCSDDAGRKIKIEIWPPQNKIVFSEIQTQRQGGE